MSKIYKKEEEKIIQIVHLSDIHYSDAYFVPEIADSMVDSINRLEPDLVAITGDLTENGFSAEYEGVKGFIDRIECKNKILVPGNHDSKNAGYIHFEDLFKDRYFHGILGMLRLSELTHHSPILMKVTWAGKTTAGSKKPFPGKISRFLPCTITLSLYLWLAGKILSL